MTKLSANLVCSARNVVAEAYKRDKEKGHRWKETAAIRYDARTLTVKLDQQYATLTTLDGRARVNLILSDYHRQYVDGTWEVEPTAAIRSGTWPASTASRLNRLMLVIHLVRVALGMWTRPTEPRNLRFAVLFAAIRIMLIMSLLTISPLDTLNSDASP